MDYNAQHKEILAIVALGTLCIVLVSVLCMTCCLLRIRQSTPVSQKKKKRKADPVAQAAEEEEKLRATLRLPPKIVIAGGNKDGGGLLTPIDFLRDEPIIDRRRTVNETPVARIDVSDLMEGNKQPRRYKEI